MKKKVSFLCVLSLIVQMLVPFAFTTAMAADEETVVYEIPDSPAEIYNMNVDWKFKKADSASRYPLKSAADSVKDANGKNFYEVDFDDSSWETVSVPHPINAEDSFDGNCYDSGEAGLYRGFMFYRKHITVPETDAGKKFFLEFEAVRQSVYLYVNGEIVGYYEAGIAAMGFDITDKIKVGEDNLIAVATDNASDRGESDNSKVTHETKPGSEPGAADGYGFQWNTKDFNEVQGGITGNVNLYAKGTVYQTLPLYNNLKTTGNYIYATDFDIREGKATVTVEGEVRNESADNASVSLEVNITEKVDPNKDVEGDDVDHTKVPKLVASFKSDVVDVAVAEDKGKVFASVIPEDAYADEPKPTTTETTDVTKVIASSDVEGLKFWSPDSPNLYDVYTVIKDADGKVLDVQKITTGFRKVEYDINDGGLKINDEPEWLTGYAQRSTNEWAVIGVANDWLQDLDMQWVKESNSNFIRWMHVAPKPSQIRSGDKYGVVSAAPAGDKEADTTGRSWDQRVEAMRDTMIYFRNSPSVLFWEAGNNAITAEHQQEMTDLKSVLDPNGGRFAGCRTISSVDQINATEYVGTMLNRHAGSAKASMATAKKYVPIMETEYAREEAPRRVWDDFSPPDYDYDNKWLGSGASKQDGYDVHDLTSEDFAVVDTKAYNEFYSDRVGGSTGNDYYSAAAIMVWSDSNMHNRNTASENCRTSGKVDPVRIKKQAFYALQAAQSDTPKVHIVGHWNYPQVSDDTYNYAEKEHNGKYWEKTGNMLKRDPKNKTVYVIGSAGLSKVELYVNDVLKGTSTKPDSTFVYSFPNIDVTESGTVKAVAYNAQEQVVAEHQISTVGEAATIKLTPVTGPDGLIADGSDIAYFDLAIVDKDGNTCPLAYDKINLSVSGEGVLLGGYNSGVGDKITTNKDYCYAECGTNRIFVRSTRNAGDVILSASLEGQPAVTAKITSVNDLEMTDGLTTKAQRAFEQGEVVQVVKQEVDPLKSLAGTFTADFGEENSNVYVVEETDDKDEYTMNINGEEITGYTNVPYRPDRVTGVLCDVIKTLDALKKVKPDIEYTLVTEGDIPTGYDGSWPMVSIKGGLKVGYTQVDVMNGSTTLFINKGEDKNLMNAQIESKGDELVVEIAAVLGYLDGVTNITDEDEKTLNITVSDENGGGGSAPEYTLPATMEYSDNNVKVTANSSIDKANVIFVSFDNKGYVTGIKIEKEITLDKDGSREISIPESFADKDNVKVMLWNEKLEKPLSKTAGKIVLPETQAEKSDMAVNLYEDLFAGDVQTLDVLVSEHNGESTSLANTTIEDGAPDGTKYIKVGDSGNNKYGEYCFESECSFGGNTKEDVMIACDVRFDAEYAGVTAEDSGDSRIAGAVVLKGSTIQVQKDSKNYNDTKIAVDNDTWYHLAMVGRYSASDANVDLYVWKYNDDGSLTYVNKASSIPLRNLSASNNKGVHHLNVMKNTSVDNIKLYKINADAIALDSAEDNLKAGESMLFTHTATRAGEYITAPSVKWEVYNEANDAVLEDENITISDGGLLTISGNAVPTKINVRATADTGVYASKAIEVKGIDKTTDTYDELEISADSNTVRVGKNVNISVTAKLKGETVTPGADDLKYVICNAANLRELGNKNVTITADGVLSVTEDVLPQTITVKATNKSGSVSATCQIEVLPANMNSGNEDLYSDTFASADACEEYVTGLALTEGSWDGSAYYNVTSAWDFVGFPSNTDADVIYSADMQFANDGAGWTIFSANKGKLGLQLSSSGTTLNALGASNKVVGSVAIDKDAWYNVSVMCKTGATGYYATMMVYKYDENGKRVNPQTGDEGTPYILTCSLRNLGESQANHININAGTNVDNILNMYVAPDELKLTVDVQTVLAGNSAQASTVAYRKGIEFPSLNSSLIKYEIYDADNKYPIAGDFVTVDPSGKITVDPLANPQDVYVRVSSTSGGMNDSKKLTIKSSDIFEVTGMGFADTEYSQFKQLKVVKNFNYDNDVTFISAVYDANGALKAIATKKAYGDQLVLGENNISMNMTMPQGFDKVNDRLNAFVVTKLSTSKQTEGADLTVTADGTSTSVTNIPNFDAGSKVVVLVLKAGADEEAVSDNDIAYFNQVLANEISDNSLTLPVEYSDGMIVKVIGTVNGVHTISK